MPCPNFRQIHNFSVCCTESRRLLNRTVSSDAQLWLETKLKFKLSENVMIFFSRQLNALNPKNRHINVDVHNGTGARMTYTWVVMTYPVWAQPTNLWQFSYDVNDSEDTMKTMPVCYPVYLLNWLNAFRTPPNQIRLCCSIFP